jgi:hypothetical protein
LGGEGKGGRERWLATTKERGCLFERKGFGKEGWGISWCEDGGVGRSEGLGFGMKIGDWKDVFG